MNKHSKGGGIGKNFTARANRIKRRRAKRIIDYYSLSKEILSILT
jgi:hypothetical protein